MELKKYLEFFKYLKYLEYHQKDEKDKEPRIEDPFNNFNSRFNREDFEKNNLSEIVTPQKAQHQAMNYAENLILRERRFYGEITRKREEQITDLHGEITGLQDKIIILEAQIAKPEEGLFKELQDQINILTGLESSRKKGKRFTRIANSLLYFTFVATMVAGVGIVYNQSATKHAKQANYQSEKALNISQKSALESKEKITSIESILTGSLTTMKAENTAYRDEAKTKLANYEDEANQFKGTAMALIDTKNQAQEIKMQRTIQEQFSKNNEKLDSLEKAVLGLNDLYTKAIPSLEDKTVKIKQDISDLKEKLKLYNNEITLYKQESDKIKETSMNNIDSISKELNAKIEDLKKQIKEISILKF